MQTTEELKFLPEYTITVNTNKDDFFLFIANETRGYETNTEFQHFHNYYEIFIPMEDNISHIIEGRYFELHRYDFVLLRPNLLHKAYYHKTGGRNRVIINFKFSNNIYGISDEIKDVLSIFNSDVPIFRFSVENRIKLSKTLNEIFENSYNKEKNSSFFATFKLFQFLNDFDSLHDKNQYKIVNSKNQIISKIYDVASYIHLNLKENLNLTDIADTFSINEFYLSHKFKEITGFTLVSYIQRARLRKVQNLLLNSSKQIKEIVYECGFNSFSQFNRVFKKYTNMSPTEFRNNGQKITGSFRISDTFDIK
ncbi:MAG: helix-turn-helix domain-containing protein [Sphaerochaeta sp.]